MISILETTLIRDTLSDGPTTRSRDGHTTDRYVVGGGVVLAAAARRLLVDHRTRRGHRHHR
jgi:hypothetical protein